MTLTGWSYESVMLMEEAERLSWYERCVDHNEKMNEDMKGK